MSIQILGTGAYQPEKIITRIKIPATIYILYFMVISFKILIVSEFIIAQNGQNVKSKINYLKLSFFCFALCMINTPLKREWLKPH